MGFFVDRGDVDARYWFLGPLRPTKGQAMRSLPIAAILLAIVGCDRVKAPGDAPKKAAGAAAYDEWTHKDIRDSLSAKGMKVGMKETHHGSFYGPAAYLHRDDVVVDEQTSEKTDGVVYVLKLASPQAAKDRAALRDQTAFSWGPFLFESHDSNLLRQVKSALP